MYGTGHTRQKKTRIVLFTDVTPEKEQVKRDFFLLLVASRKKRENIEEEETFRKS